MHDGNILFANQIADALRRSDSPPPTVVYANSVQAGNGTVYGEAKAKASNILAEAAAQLEIAFINLRLPNLFGEHGRPFYNAVTATFCHLLAEGKTPEVAQDKELTLLHAQDAADLLTGVVDAGSQADLEEKESVSGLLRRLSSQAETYNAGEIPDISERFDKNLFNTYRSYTFDRQTPIRLTRHADNRGSFFEIIRSQGDPDNLHSRPLSLVSPVEIISTVARLNDLPYLQVRQRLRCVSYSRMKSSSSR